MENYSEFFRGFVRKRIKVLRIMKLTLMLLIVGALQLSANVYSQNGRINVNVEEMELADLLWELQESSGIVFAYRTSDLEGMDPVTANFEGATITEILDEVLEDTHLDYKIDKDVVVIVRKPVKKVNKSETTQERIKIKGAVTDQNGDPVPFASVCFKGTTNGCVAALDGAFEIEMIEDPNAMLVVSCIGFTTIELPIGDKRTFDIVLLDATEGLDEVVVTGYQTISKERSSGSFGKIDSEELDIKQVKSIAQKLEGMTSGVLYNSEGDITIRGVGSFSANTKPLIVLDGYPIQGDMSDINPNDVKDITILKDAAASSIWGARAANGVIVIRTKKGAKKGKPKVDFSSSLSITSAPNLGDFQLASSKTILDVEKLRSDFNLIKRNPSGADRAFTLGQDIYLKYPNATPSAEDQTKLDALAAYNVNGEFEDLFFRTATRENYNIAVSGAGERNTYYASIGYDMDRSFSKGDDDSRLNLNLRTTFDITDKLRVGVNVYSAFGTHRMNGIGMSDYQSISQYQRILGADGGFINQPFGVSETDKANFAQTGYPYDWSYNLKQEYDNKNNRYKRKVQRINVSADYDILSSLKLKVGYLKETTSQSTRNYYNENTFYTRNLVNSHTHTDNGQLVSPVPTGDILSKSEQAWEGYTFRSHISFDKNWGDIHKFNAIGGFEAREEKFETDNFGNYGYDSQSLNYKEVDYTKVYKDVFGQAASVPRINSYGKVVDRFISYFANAAYTLKNRYTLTGSFRVDDSNLFGATDKYRNVPLWSVGTSWNIAREDFFNMDKVNLLKLRITYGVNGNVDKSTSPHLTARLDRHPQLFYDYAVIVNPTNPDLRWEKTKQTNIAVDFAAFNNRLSGSIDWYHKKSSDLLSTVSLNSILGFSSAKLNNGEMLNTGFDTQIGYQILDGGVKWHANLTYSYNKNEVKKVDLADETVDARLRSPQIIKGKPLHYLYSYRWAGLSADGLPQVKNENGEVVPYTTTITDAKALKYEGSRTPKHYGSLINTVSYKNFSLSAMLVYKLGFVFREPTVDYNYIYSGTFQLNHIHKDIQKRWMQAGDENRTNIPVLPGVLDSPFNYQNYTTYGSHLVKKGDNIRLREVVLTYQLPEKIMNGLPLDRLSFSVQGRNLFTYTFDDTDYDPEYELSLFGLQPRPELTFSLKATF